MIEKLRINNLEFAPASYLLPKEEYPEKFSWHINYYYPNSYFGREKEFRKRRLVFRSNHALFQNS